MASLDSHMSARTNLLSAVIKRWRWTTTRSDRHASLDVWAIRPRICGRRLPVRSVSLHGKRQTRVDKNHRVESIPRRTVGRFLFRFLPALAVPLYWRHLRIASAGSRYNAEFQRRLRYTCDAALISSFVIYKCSFGCIRFNLIVSPTHSISDIVFWRIWNETNIRPHIWQSSIIEFWDNLKAFSVWRVPKCEVMNLWKQFRTIK